MRVRTAAIQADINVTPLVDVCLVLLIIFMVVTPMMVTGMPIDLPRASTAVPIDSRPLQISLKSNGTIYVGANAVRSDELASELVRISASGTARPVVIQADKSLPYGSVVDALDACRKAGYGDVG